MKSFVLKIDFRDTVELHDVYAWMGRYVIDRWSITRLSIDAIKVDFFGINQELEIVAFRLRYGV